MDRKYSVDWISAYTAKIYINEHHYTRNSPHSPYVNFGLYIGKEIVGAIMFCSPTSETSRTSIFGSEYKHWVVDLSRLHILDGQAKNIESWFIARSLKQLKRNYKHLHAVTAFADSTENHIGTVYQASNFYYYGVTIRENAFLDADGRLRSCRQNGKMISLEDAKSRGWTMVKRQKKHRYVKFLPDLAYPHEKLKEMCKLNFLSYPKSSAY